MNEHVNVSYVCVCSSNFIILMDFHQMYTKSLFQEYLSYKLNINDIRKLVLVYNQRPIYQQQYSSISSV